MRIRRSGHCQGAAIISQAIISLVVNIFTRRFFTHAWFHAAAGQCAALCFTRGRIRFVGASGEIAAPTQGQAFFYFGPSIERFRETFGGFGFIR